MGQRVHHNIKRIIHRHEKQRAPPLTRTQSSYSGSATSLYAFFPISNCFQEQVSVIFSQALSLFFEKK